MTLVDREIKEQHDDLILQGYDEKNVNPISYDLTIGSILLENGETDSCRTSSNRTDSFTLSPNTTVFIKTKEEVHIPDNLCGHIEEKNSRMREGLWVSGPNYFPGHTTFVFLRVRNVSQNEITIKAGDRIAQISFEKLMEQPDHPYNTLSNASFNEEDEYRGMGKYASKYKERIKPVSNKTNKLYATILTLMALCLVLFPLLALADFVSKTPSITINLSFGFAIGLFVGLCIGLILLLKDSKNWQQEMEKSVER